MPSSTLVEVGVEVEVEATSITFMGGWVGWCGEAKTRANLSQV